MLHCAMVKVVLVLLMSIELCSIYVMTMYSSKERTKFNVMVRVTCSQTK